MLKDYQTDFADKADNFPRDLVSMHERMSIACNEDKFMKKGIKKKKDVTSKISLNTAVPLGTGADEAEQARLENEAYKLDFVKQKHDACIQDQTLDSNLREAYTIIFSNFCDKELQNRLENKKDFTTKIENDPRELLAVIREMMHTTSHERLIYPFEIL